MMTGGWTQRVKALAINRMVFKCAIVGSGQLPDLSTHLLLAPGQPLQKELFSWPSLILHFLIVCVQTPPVWTILDGLIKPFSLKYKSSK